MSKTPRQIRVFQVTLRCYDFNGATWGALVDHVNELLADIPPDQRHAVQLNWHNGWDHESSEMEFSAYRDETEEEERERVELAMATARYRQRHAEAAERALFARLKAKYEGS